MRLRDVLDADHALRVATSLAIRAGLGVLVALIVLVVSRLTPLQRIEARVLDHRILLWRQLSEGDVSSITLVPIDAPSLAELHLAWPLPASVYARAIDRLRKSGAEVIGVTIPFLDEGPLSRNASGAADASAVDPVLRAVLEGFDDVVVATRVGKSTHALTSRLCATGVCEVAPDADGVTRRFDPTPLTGEAAPGAGETAAPSVGLALLRARYRNPGFVPRGFAELPGTRYPIAWAGAPDDTFATLSLKKVLAGGDISKEVKGRIVLLGSALPGPDNEVMTPFSRAVWGGSSEPMTTLELTANVLFTLSGSNALTSLTTAQFVALVGGGTLALFVLFSGLHPLLSFVGALFVSAMAALAAVHAQVMHGLLLPVVPTLLGVQAAWFAAMAYQIVGAVHQRYPRSTPATAVGDVSMRARRRG